MNAPYSVVGSEHAIAPVERFPAKRIPVRVKKTRQNKRLELRSDSIGTEKALGPRLTVFSRCWAALLDWRERLAVRERLSDLSDRELRDIGIARGEIDYVASNRAIDPRGIR
jgi:uncharacterized protein YjiS (DUF1127 family)